MASRLPSLLQWVLTGCFLVVAVTLLTGEVLSRQAIWIRFLVGCLVAAPLGVWLTRGLSRSLAQLVAATDAYSRGDVARRCGSSSVREIQELSGALNAMAQALSDHIGELTGQRNQATAVLESMAEGVIALDARGRILLINPAAARLFGLAPGPVTGQSLVEVVRQPEIHELAQQLLRQAHRLTRDLTVFHPAERTLRVHAVPCQAIGASGPFAVLVIQDVTEAHRYEQLRKEFVANVSHELKSPLTSIRSLTETLLGGALQDPANNQRFVQLIEEDAARLSRLIDDLLTLSQLESQAAPLRLEPVMVRPLIDALLGTFRQAIGQRHLTVEMDVADALSVQADADRLRQVLSNLIDNAVKYNRDGGAIRIAAAQEPGRVVIAIADTGIGIPEQDLPRVFERFYRVDKARSRELGGTGLGLSIVKHIAEAHGGSVSVTSRLQQGSTFTLTFPS